MPSSRTFAQPPKKVKKREPSYETYDECLDGGVEMEEQGERFRLGEKAERYFGKSLELYKRATGFSATFDASYNTARVLYILATSFYLPPRSLSLLEEATMTFREAISNLVTNNTPGSIQSFSSHQALLLDAQYNLAQALLDLAELQETASAGDVIASQRSDAGRTEGLGLLYVVAEGQTAWVAHRSAEEEGSTMQADIPDDDSGIGVEPESSTGMDVDDTQDDGRGSSPEETYEIHEPTPGAVVETLLLIVDTHLTMWESQSPEQEGSISENVQAELTALDGVLSRIRAQYPSVSSALIEAEIAAIDIASSLAHRRSGAADTSLTLEALTERSNEADAMLRRLTSLAQDPAYVGTDPLVKSKIAERTLEILSWKAKLQSNPAWIATKGASDAWTTLSTATKTATAASSIPVPILDAPLYKPSILLELASLSLRRVEFPHPSAQKGREQLLINAETYVNQALEALGWGYFVSSQAVNTSGGTFLPRTPAQGGWEREYLARKCLYRLAQALIRASSAEGPRGGNGEGKLKAWVEKVVALGSTGTRKLTAQNVKDIVEEDQEDGLTTLSQELAFWTDFVQRS